MRLFRGDAFVSLTNEPCPFPVPVEITLETRGGQRVATVVLSYYGRSDAIKASADGSFEGAFSLAEEFRAWCQEHVPGKAFSRIRGCIDAGDFPMKISIFCKVGDQEPYLEINGAFENPRLVPAPPTIW